MIKMINIFITINVTVVVLKIIKKSKIKCNRLHHSKIITSKVIVIRIKNIIINIKVIISITVIGVAISIKIVKIKINLISV